MRTRKANVKEYREGNSTIRTFLTNPDPADINLIRLNGHELTWRQAAKLGLIGLTYTDKGCSFYFKKPIDQDRFGLESIWLKDDGILPELEPEPSVTDATEPEVEVEPDRPTMTKDDRRLRGYWTHEES